MSDTSPNLGLPYIQPSQAQKHVTHNEAISLIDALVQLVVLDRDRTSPPASPTEGDRHIVAAGATGAWAGHGGDVAVFLNNGWVFLQSKTGWKAWIFAEDADVLFDGTNWTVAGANFENLAGVGIGTTSDSTNRLAVVSQATLLTHTGAGHQLKVNKAAAGDTASLMFQTGFSGRAEMGTTGSDGFSIKVSADGTTWKQALSFNPATAAASGLAVQQSATDVTAGRLMRADFGYGPGNVLGTVGQSAGVPTGSVVERGTNANGEYVRFADGTQICTFATSLGSIRATGSGTWAAPYRTSPDYSWTFPAVFAATPTIVGRGRAPSGATTLRIQSIVNFGLASTTSCPQISISRIGSDTTADIFSVGLLAVGRWF